MSSSINATRKATVIDMLMRPVMNNGMGLTSLEAAVQQIQQTTRDTCEWLFAEGVAPENVSLNLLELLVWKELFVLCGHGAHQFPWVTNFLAALDGANKTAVPSADLAMEYQVFCDERVKLIIEERKQQANRAREDVKVMLKLLKAVAPSAKQIDETAAGASEPSDDKSQQLESLSVLSTSTSSGSEPTILTPTTTEDAPSARSVPSPTAWHTSPERWPFSPSPWPISPSLANSRIYEPLSPFLGGTSVSQPLSPSLGSSDIDQQLSPFLAATSIPKDSNYSEANDKNSAFGFPPPARGNLDTPPISPRAALYEYANKDWDFTPTKSTPTKSTRRTQVTGNPKRKSSCRDADAVPRSPVTPEERVCRHGPPREPQDSDVPPFIMNSSFKFTSLKHCPSFQ